MSEEESSPAVNIARISVKVPPLWRANPEIWFSQMESQFVLAGITTEITKFHNVVSALQPEELGIVGDIILSPPVVKPYTALRTRLCSQYAETEEQRLRGLILGMQLGDHSKKTEDKKIKISELPITSDSCYVSSCRPIGSSYR
ncbi:retrovirus-related Pol polyprotein from transposon 297 [Trichonephila clavata]|uniref:Retrovirus-related Pol polyprotein from transposon 297 n=1 Tax=Trichonephila clavata TaxID=2740835 RepID=A0A8X6LGA0_TRICU|nr:retrovirus-related Pol polyprotein from transposon 297 [Trichonephila clavata]